MTLTLSPRLRTLAEQSIDLARPEFGLAGLVSR
jgi:hypothetical protein